MSAATGTTSDGSNAVTADDVKDTPAGDETATAKTANNDATSDDTKTDPAPQEATGDIGAPQEQRPQRSGLDKPLGPLNDNFKFFVANLPLDATPLALREHFEVCM